MDKIFQKHRDTKPMDEQFFEAFKEVFDIDAYLKGLFNHNHPQFKTKSGKMDTATMAFIDDNRPTATNLVSIAVHIMKYAYELHAQSSKPEKEITLNA